MLLFCDSFDHYNSSQFLRKWDAASPITPVIGSVGRNGTNGVTLGVSGSFTGYVTKTMSSNVATGIVGGAYKFTVTGGTAVIGFLGLMDSGTSQVYLQRTIDGSITAYRGAFGSGTLLGTSTTGVVASTSVHHYIELKSAIHNTTGTIEVHVNGVAVLTLASQNTRASSNNYFTQVAVGPLNAIGSASVSVDLDDFYVCDTTGSSCTNFLGDVRVEALLPNGAGGNTDFTASAGSNYQCTDDNPANDDTDYVSSATVGDMDTYAFGNLSSSVGSVLAVAVNTVDRKEDSGGRTHSHLIFSGSTVVSGAAYAPATAYANHQTVFHTNPGGGAWTIADVNGVEAGHKIES